ncbi:MAG: sodium ion-translocating decarboxylase subunit beta, partial [Bacilli bacterium]|nr:sodium ion-translocating decarboxylase subunit beta [Bacilli bacterium]
MVEGMALTDFFVGDGWMRLIMLLIGGLFLFLAIKKNFEPYLLIPIAFGIILVNIFPNIYFHSDTATSITDPAVTIEDRGLLGVLHLGVEHEIYPCLIFLGIGATTDFGPLIANKKTMLLGAAAQIGIFAAFFGSLLLGFNYFDASAIGIIGGADGPTAILVSNKMASAGGSAELLAPIALAAYSYMA